MKRPSKLQHTGGFTLVEVIIAILLMGIIIAAGATAAGNGLTSTFAARDQVTAFYLAQEAAELVKNRRDVNSQKIAEGEEIDWLDGIDICFDKDCEVDAITGEIRECEDGCVVKQNEDGFYGFFEGDDDAVDSIYTRTVHVEPDPISDDEIRIDVTMEWDGRVLTLREHVFNWRN